MNQTLVALLAVVLGVVAVVADGRRAVAVTATAAGVALAPAVALVAGGTAALLPLGGAAATWLALLAGRRGGLAYPWVAGLDPLSAVTPAVGLFGPRSIRVAAAGVSLPAASWVGLNVAVGGLITASGVVFALAYLFAVGGWRLLLARTLEDISCGVAICAEAAAGTWLVQAGQPGMPEAMAAVAVAPTSALVVGWLTSRHGRAAATERAAA